MPRRPLILCVDDEWNGLEGRKTLFEETGCKVLVATSGAEALQLFASHPVDLVLLDYHMPGMNGDVVAEHMKAGQPDVPIALLSADAEPPEHALRWVDAFVSKSESPANLLQIVEHLLDLCLLFAIDEGAYLKGSVNIQKEAPKKEVLGGIALSPSEAAQPRKR
jgi:CheY-like chemotaxis protein